MVGWIGARKTRHRKRDSTAAKEPWNGGLDSGQPRPPPDREPVPEEIRRVAKAVRAALLEDFPDRPTLFKQCKRASVLLDQVLGRRGLHVSLRTGYVLGQKGGDRGTADHTWCRLKHPQNGRPYLLDVTLTQFADLFGHAVPEIVWGEYRQISRRYGYVEDGQGNWLYDPRDFDLARVEAVEELLCHPDRFLPARRGYADVA